MTKRAHITSRPDHLIGDKVLGLCGKKFTVTELWDDLPKDKPICRDCVDQALMALTEADELIETARLQLVWVQSRISRLDRTLNPDMTILDAIAEADQEYQAKQEEKALAKEPELPQVNCICTWTDAEHFTVNPDCPIHGAPITSQEEDQND
jgi:hypothetical protein